MTALLINTYLKNHYRPTALLAMFFGTFTIAFIFVIPTFWLPFSAGPIAWFLMEASVVSLFLMFTFLIMAFEGMKGQILSPISTLFIALTAVTISLFLTILTSGYFYTDMWWTLPNDDFDIMFVAYVLIAVIIVLFRLIQFIRYERPGREKKMTIIALSGFLATIVGAVGTYALEGIPNLDYTFMAIGTTLIAAMYIKYPHSFFLSNTRINAIMLINSSNKLPFLIIGEKKEGDKGSSYALAAAGLGGVAMLLQEMLGAERPPTRLYHKDKGIMLQHDLKHEISGVIVADQINDVLRSPLKHAIKLFVKRFEAEIADWVGEVSGFQVFEEDLKRIFKFALPQSD